MKLIIYILLLLYSHILFANNYEGVGIPMTTIYSPEQHLGTNQSWWLVQAENGLIYNGTGLGLNEWDGENWSNYKLPQFTRIRSLSPWNDGKIYIGTTNDIGFYSPNTQGKLKYTSLMVGLSPDQHQFGEIWSVAANKSGVLFASSKILFFWDGKKLKTIIDNKSSVHSVFSYGDDAFIYKHPSEEKLKIIHTTPELRIEELEIALPKGAKIRKAFFNQNNNLTIFTDVFGIYEKINGVLIKRIDSNQFPANTNLYNAIQASDGYYYVTSLNQGLFILSSELKILRQYTQQHQLGMTTILSVMEDNQSNIWLSGVPNIVKMLPPHRYSTFNTTGHSRSSEKIGLFQNQVTVAGDDIYQLSKPENTSEPYYFNKLTPDAHTTQSFIEYNGFLVSSEFGGIYYQKIVDDKPTDYTQLIDTFISVSMAIDPISKKLYATSNKGLYHIYEKDNTLESKFIEGIKDEIEHIVISDEGIIWAGTSTQELYRIENAQYDDKQIIVQKFTGKDGLGKNNVIPFKISSGVVFGTNNGLMDFQQDRQPQLQFMLQYPKELFNTVNLDVFRIYEDSSNRIWFRNGQRTGFIEKDTKGKWQSYEDLFKPLPDSGYKGFVVTDEHILWVTMANGQIFRLDIDQIMNIPNQGQLNIRKITKLETAEEIFGGLGQPILPLLDQQNNSIRINYALTENVIPGLKTYRHRLVGSDYAKWSTWSFENKKDFTLLRGNDYLFQLEAKDHWGRISSTGMGFKVAPFWYLSTMAWFIYFILLIVLLIITGWLTQKWRTKQLNLRNQQLEQQVVERTADVQEKVDELNQQQILKDRFFTNVSHEFRTPLTLIIAPLTSLVIDNPNLKYSIRHPIKTAIRNSKKMLSLVGQVLDINRLESGRFQLRVAQYDVIDLITNTIKRLKPWAKQQGQKLISVDLNEPVLLFYDLDQLDKCLTNLIVNAIKYSGDDSTIEISLCNREHNSIAQTGIKVSDNGKGISDEFVDKIFKRFSQDKNSESNSQPGTGIGLALVAELMELHQGDVELINQAGCSFILWLNHGHDHFDESILIEPIAMDDEVDEFNEIELTIPQKITQQNDGDDITTILIVDDNQELREFIVSRFSHYYRILQASDGEQGLAIAKSQLPDLIISDVMMPKMNGYEMVRKLKASELTNEIPIILLSAKSTKRETVEGLQTGADDYLTKPFDTSELIVRANGLINTRKLIRKKIQRQFSQQVTDIKSNASFVDKLHNEVLKQLSNPKLTIDSLSETLLMSRATLNRKCKAELKQSPNQYITEIRMQHALTLIKAKKHRISEIAYGTGYESLAYFSRSFKKFYGDSPSSLQIN